MNSSEYDTAFKASIAKVDEILRRYDVFISDAITENKSRSTVDALRDRQHEIRHMFVRELHELDKERYDLDTDTVDS